MDDENIFDDDDALDYIISEEIEEEQEGNTASGCLSTIVIIALPAATFGMVLFWGKLI